MRLKRNRLKTYYHTKRIIEKDKEGGTIETYGAAVSFSGEVWPGGGKLQAEMYGERLPYIRNIRVDGVYEIQEDEKGTIHYIFKNGLDMTEGDGLYLYTTEKPDYRIISIKPYRFLTLEAEKI